jgi:uncharacterized protein
MGQPVVHFEISGREPDRLRRDYAELFGGEYEVGDTVSAPVSEPGGYGFVDVNTLGGASGVNGRQSGC